MRIVSLFDESGNMVRPWAEAGHDCYCLDILNDGFREEFSGGGSIEWIRWDAKDRQAINAVVALNPEMLFSFAPCTDLAVSGAKHFASKAERNPLYRTEAMNMVYAVRDVAARAQCPWMLENPVGVISTEWRKPDHIFHPWEYGGYLPEDDIHPRWPQYIASRDAYPKKTCIWSGNGFVMPEKRPVVVRDGWSDQQKMLGGKSKKTKQIRSETPRGFATAVYGANS